MKNGRPIMNYYQCDDHLSLFIFSRKDRLEAEHKAGTEKFEEVIFDGYE